MTFDLSEIKSIFEFFITFSGSVGAGGAAVYAWMSRNIKKSALRDIGGAFNSTILGLSSQNIEVRMASAVLLRRFFDENTELGVGGTPFAKEAISSISAVLRETRTSKFQKVLADGLRFAPRGMLRGADFQGVNLTKASLGGSSIDFSQADFFQANLSGATLRDVVAEKAVFVEATLIGTSFKNAKLAGADFRGAMIESSSFDGAELTGANFSGATLRNIKLPDNSGAITNGAIFQDFPVRREKSADVVVFLSRPGVLNRAQEKKLELVTGELKEKGCELMQLTPDQYDQTSIMSNLTKRVGLCHGLVVLGFSSVQIHEGIYRPSTEQSHPIRDISLATAWNHVEAGMGLMKKIPILLLSDNGITEGVFDPNVNDPLIFRSTFDESLNPRSKVMQLWMTAVLKHHGDN